MLETEPLKCTGEQDGTERRATGMDKKRFCDVKTAVGQGGARFRGGRLGRRRGCKKGLWID